MNFYSKCMGCLELQVYYYCLPVILVSDVYATGRHCCLFCTITADQLKIPPALRDCVPQTRTLKSLKEDYDRFIASGGDVKHAKHYNNVICPFFFDIPLDQVNIHALNIGIIQ